MIHLYLLVDDFNAFNADALARVQAVNPDPSATSYTFAIPHNDGVKSWAKIEQGFYDVATPEEIIQMKTREEALALGMTIPEGEE